MRLMMLLLLFGLAPLSLGCSTGPDDTPVDVQAPSPVEDMKSVLQGIIDSGEPPGSGAYALQQDVEKIKATDPDKAAKLQPLVDEMMSINDSGKAKSKAKEMLDILGS